MAELSQMLERNFGGPYVVEDDVCNAFDFVVSGYGDDRNGERKGPWRVDRNESIDGPLDEESGIFVNIGGPRDRR